MTEPKEVKVACYCRAWVYFDSLQGLFSVSTTSVKEPASVLREIVRVLRMRPNFQVQEEGFLVKAKVFNVANGKHEMTLTFEVCKISRMEITGVKLKRVKGDTWAYKKVCR